MRTVYGMHMQGIRIDAVSCIVQHGAATGTICSTLTFTDCSFGFA